MHVNMSPSSVFKTSLRQPPPSAPCIRRFMQKATPSQSWSVLRRGTGTWPGWKRWRLSTEHIILAETADPLTLRGLCQKSRKIFGNTSQQCQNCKRRRGDRHDTAVQAHKKTVLNNSGFDATLFPL